MPSTTPSEIIGPPCDELVEALESVVADDLRVVAEYNASTYNLLYVADDVFQRYADTDELRGTADDVHNCYYLDKLESDLLESALPYGETGSIVTYFEQGTVLRAFRSTAEVFIATDTTASVDDIQEIIANTLDQ